MLCIDGLTPYEKGVVARWLLSELIGKAKVVTEGSDAFVVTIGIPKWQLRILAHFCGGQDQNMAVSKAVPDPNSDINEFLC
jgi:hypothetical protein